MIRTASFLLLAAAGIACGRPSLAADCTVSSSGVVFGSYDPLDAADTHSAGSIRLNCDEPVTASITLSGDGTADRAMRNGGSELAYQLYVDPQRRIVWGDGSGASDTVTVEGTVAERPVYAAIPARQPVTAGSYADTIVLTLSY